MVLYYTSCTFKRKISEALQELHCIMKYVHLKTAKIWSTTVTSVNLLTVILSKYHN